MTGSVSRQSPGRPWQAVKLGDVLGREDAIRTAPGATADLSMGEDSRITVEAETQVRVVEVSKAVQELKLRRGRLSVVHNPEGGRILRIRGHSGSAAIEVKRAAFDVSETGQSFAVATRAGRVDLTAAGKTVAVAAGEQSIVRGEQGPSAAAPIPTDLLLKVARAGHKRKKEICTVVSGHTTAGAEVTVAGQVVVVGEDGTFRVPVPRIAGRAKVEVVVQDALGRRKHESLACDPVPQETADPIQDLQVDWGSHETKPNRP